MYCTKCISVIPDGSKYCWKCGKKQHGKESADLVCITVQKYESDTHVHLVIPINMTGEELMVELINRNFVDDLKVAQVYTLFFERKNQIINPNEFLSSLNIKNGDIISVGIFTRG